MLILGSVCESVSQPWHRLCMNICTCVCVEGGVTNQPVNLQCKYTAVRIMRWFPKCV